MMTDRLLTEKEQDDCVATDAQLEAYLAEPDDAVAASLPDDLKRRVARFILYGRNIAETQDTKSEPLVRADMCRETAAYLSERCDNVRHSKAGHYRRFCQACIDRLVADGHEGHTSWETDSAPDAEANLPGASCPGLSLDSTCDATGQRCVPWSRKDCFAGIQHTCYYCDHEGTDVNRVAVVTTFHTDPGVIPFSVDGQQHTHYCCDDGDACDARIKETTAKESKHRAFLHDTGGGRKA